MKLLIFSDLDGSLLDDEDYSFRGAEPALESVRRLRVPLILVTSKTRSEVEAVRVRLGNDDPFVVENGGGVFFPVAGGRPPDQGVEVRDGYYRLRLGLEYAAIRAFVDDVGSEMGVYGFGDMSDGEVAGLTGLDDESAARARQREFTEPFLLRDPARLEDLRMAAARYGISLTRGGRFHHLVGARQDKGRAVRIVARVLSQSHDSVRTVGLGDSPNDLPMLEEVDVAVVIPRPDGSHLSLERCDSTLAPMPGSRGWNEAVLAILAAPRRRQEPADPGSNQSTS